MIISLPQLPIFLPSLTFCLLDSQRTYLFLFLIQFAHFYINTYLFLLFIGHEFSLAWYAPGTFRTTTYVIPVHFPHVSAELAQSPCPWFSIQRCLCQRFWALLNVPTRHFRGFCLPDAGTSCTEILRTTIVEVRSLSPWACDHSQWCPALYELCKLESFFSSLLRFEPMSSGTETQHNINCTSQTAVMMEGIIRVYMFNCASVFSS